MQASKASLGHSVVRDQFAAAKESLESIAASALQSVCKSVNYPDTVTFAVASTEDAVRYQLRPEEDRALSPRAGGKRRLSWIRGRMAARIALEHLGVAERAPLLRGDAGEPIWPNGISGSITHCDPWSIAAVTPSSGSVFLGIDLENIDRIQELEIASLVCRPSERAWIHSGNNSRERLCMLFSAKEALYKSIFPSYRRYVDFIEVGLSWSADESGFQAAIPPSETQTQSALSFISLQHCKNLIFSCSLYMPQ